MADVHTLGKILAKLEELSAGQKQLVEGHREIERRMEALSVPPSPAQRPAELQHRTRSSMSGGVDALNEARRMSLSRPESPAHPRSFTSGSGMNAFSPSGTGSGLGQGAPPPLPGAFSPIGSLSDASPLSKGRPAHLASLNGGSAAGSKAGGGEGVPEVPGLEALQLEAAAAGAGAPGVIDHAKLQREREGKVELYSKRVILTTYPNQPGIKPYMLNWAAGPSPLSRGPVICSRQPQSLVVRNAIGAYGGSYSTYRALTIAMKLLPADFRPDFTQTEPPFQIGPHPGWFMDETSNKPKIVSLDPWGAMSQEIWAKEYKDGLDIRPTISQTKSHIKIPELDALFREGKLTIDGTIVQKTNELPAFPGVDQGIEVAVSKASIDPVWYLPGVADRFGIDETLLRRTLFEETGGMYPELLTRPDIKVWLPPIGGITVYIIGDPAHVGNPDKELTFRPHDECNSSDTFGSDICTCRPYLMFGIEEAVKCAQRGGVGVLAYFRKEGRALGEVTKYLVYNVRKRTGDSAERYFKTTENIAGVKDQRFQDLALPDVLAWLGIHRIDNLISMSNMKYDAIIKSGVTVGKRYEIPEEFMPPDSAVEIKAKIAAGYFSNNKVTDADLQQVKGRGWENWEDVVH